METASLYILILFFIFLLYSAAGFIVFSYLYDIKQVEWLEGFFAFHLFTFLAGPFAWFVVIKWHIDEYRIRKSARSIKQCRSIRDEHEDNSI